MVRQQYRTPGAPIIPCRNDLVYDNRRNGPPPLPPSPFPRHTGRRSPSPPPQHYHQPTSRTLLRYDSPSPPPYHRAAQANGRERSVPFKTRREVSRRMEDARDQFNGSSNGHRVMEEGRKKRRRSASPPAPARGKGSAMAQREQQRLSFAHLNPPLPWVREGSGLTELPVNRKYRLPFGAKRARGEGSEAQSQAHSVARREEESEGRSVEVEMKLDDTVASTGEGRVVTGAAERAQGSAELRALQQPSLPPPLPQGLGITLGPFSNINPPPSLPPLSKSVTTSNSRSSPSLASVEPPSYQADETAFLSLRERVIKSQQARKNAGATSQQRLASSLASQPPAETAPSPPKPMLNLQPSFQHQPQLPPQPPFLSFIPFPHLQHPQPVHPFLPPNFSPYPSPEEPRLLFGFPPHQQGAPFLALPPNGLDPPAETYQATDPVAPPGAAVNGLATPEDSPVSARPEGRKVWGFESGLVGRGEIEWEDEDDEMKVEVEQVESVEREVEVEVEDKSGSEDRIEAEMGSGTEKEEENKEKVITDHLADEAGGANSLSLHATAPLVKPTRQPGLLSTLSKPLDPRPSPETNFITPIPPSRPVEADSKATSLKFDLPPAPNPSSPFARLLDFTGVPTAPRAMLKSNELSLPLRSTSTLTSNNPPAAPRPLLASTLPQRPTLLRPSIPPKPNIVAVGSSTSLIGSMRWSGKRVEMVVREEEDGMKGVDEAREGGEARSATSTARRGPSVTPRGRAASPEPRRSSSAPAAPPLLPLQGKETSYSNSEAVNTTDQQRNPPGVAPDPPPTKAELQAPSPPLNPSIPTNAIVSVGAKEFGDPSEKANTGSVVKGRGARSHGMKVDERSTLTKKRQEKFQPVSVVDLTGDSDEEEPKASSAREFLSSLDLGRIKMEHSSPPLAPSRPLSAVNPSRPATNRSTGLDGVPAQRLPAEAGTLVSGAAEC